MKYIILMYAAPDAWSPEEHRACVQESVDRCNDLHATGKGRFLGASPLQPPSTSTCVRIRDGKRSVSDGPFAEAKEVLGGYFLIDVETLDEAIAFAERLPGARRGVAEIRPLLQAPGLPDLSHGQPDATVEPRA